MKRERIASVGILSALALALYWFESMFSLGMPLPGVRLGLSHVVTIFTIWILNARAGGIVLLIRIFLGALLSGNFGKIFYSAAGGLLAYIAMAGLRQVVKENQIWMLGCLGAIAHGIGQLIVAVWMSGTSWLVLYLPILLVCCMLTGLFTGLCAQLLIKKGSHVWKTIFK